MIAFSEVRGLTVALPLDDVDTDLIIPAQFLTSVSREGYGENLFRRLRESNPEFVLNKPEFKNAKVLVSGSNFGCGSSREHAVWAIQGFGFRVVIAKSFADIFFSNSAKNGLLLVSLPSEQVDKLLAGAATENFELNVDLVAQRVQLPDGQEFTFEYDPFRKHCLLNGLDDIDYILAYKKQIAEFRRHQEMTRFFSTLPDRNQE